MIGVAELLSIDHIHGQGSFEDYESADSLRDRTKNKVYRAEIKPRWLPGGARFWYQVTTGFGSSEYVFVDSERGIRRPAFDHQRLATALASASGEAVEPKALSLRNLGFSDSEVMFDAFGKGWVLDLDSYHVWPRQATNEESNESTVEVLDRIERSRNGGGETYLTFENRLKHTVEIIWIDGAGARTSYGTVQPGESKKQHTFAGHVWLAQTENGIVNAFRAIAAPGKAVVDGLGKPRKSLGSRGRRRESRSGSSPDGKWDAYIENHNVMIRPKKDGVAFRLTTNGHAGDFYDRRLVWSPDSRRLIAVQERKGQDREVHFVESSPKDQVQPKLHTFTYPKPGDRLPIIRPRVFDVAERREILIDNELFHNPWSIDRIRWSPDGRTATFLYNQRGHQILRLIAIDPESGDTRKIVEESSPTFIDYAHKTFLKHLDDSKELIWMSERDGWNHLYLYDSTNGNVKNQITRGEWVVRGVERVDREKRRILFRASGIVPGQDPYYIHLCRVNFDGSDLVVLTGGDGTHGWEWSPNGEYFIDRWSRVDLPPVTVLRRSSDGSMVVELEKANWDSLLQTGWKVPERFVAKGRDKKTDIHGVIYRPTHYDTAKLYPVIEAIYAGPHSAFVPKEFSDYRGFQSVAELGFIVVKIDGMGTSHRSKAFHDVCWKNLGDSGFPDRILWIREAAKRYPSMDLGRVGIYGGSAGGQSTVRALLAHGDFYHVGVADCGCHDNRMDKVWWNELWMGWPVGKHYKEQSNVTQAHRLRGKLLLTVGEMDRNVDPASTMQVVAALIKADKDFELIVFPGRGHGAGESSYGERRRRDFFVRHLLDREPRWKR